MADLLFLGVTMGFFCVCAGYVTLCDRIVGIDPPPPDHIELGDSEQVQSLLVEGDTARISKGIKS
jgi:hypothetical protein